MTNTQRMIILIIVLLVMLGFVMWFIFAVLTTPAYACHKYSVWNYPWPQRCIVRVSQSEAPTPPSKPLDYYERQAPEPDMPLPSLEGMEFPPDCLADWCQRLKGIGLLREHFGTN